MATKKIVYAMNVDWNWIKQRPHFIAEELSRFYDETVVYQYRYRREHLQQTQKPMAKLCPIYVIPKLSGTQRLAWINENIVSGSIKRMIRSQSPDIVYLTYPSQRNAIPNDYSGKVFYDCMDNHSAFIRNAKGKKKIEIEEKCLIEKSTKVFVSSDYLKEELSRRYNIDENKFVLVRNAYDGKIITPTERTHMSSILRLAYIGTISSWFDWSTILKVLEKRSNIEIHLYGPIDKVEVPDNKQIFYHGVIEHAKLYETIKEMDALIMPFILNDIIKAVDPVKVYEYVNFNKNIIMCKYPEVERLKDYVYFYKDEIELENAVDAILEKREAKYSRQQRIDFLNENTWAKRVEIIKKAMEL